MILRLSLDLPEDRNYIRITRMLSRCLLEDIHVQAAIIDDVETIVSELSSNVIRHANSRDTHFGVTLEYYTHKAIITVTDKGQGFDPQATLPVGTPRPDDIAGIRLGGWGLPLVEQLSDKVDFSETDPHGTTVRVEKNLVYDTPGDAREASRRDDDGSAGVTADTG